MENAPGGTKHSSNVPPEQARGPAPAVLVQAKSGAWCKPQGHAEAPAPALMPGFAYLDLPGFVSADFILPSPGGDIYCREMAGSESTWFPLLRGPSSRGLPGLEDGSVAPNPAHLAGQLAFDTGPFLQDVLHSP